MSGAPLGLHYPQVARVRPSGAYPSCVYLRAMLSTHHACYLVLVRGTFPSWMSEACALKGVYLSIATQGSYRLSSPHPLALSTASRPGIPATAETSSRAGTRGRRVPASNQICRKHHKIRPSARRNPPEVGPRESRAGSRVPRYTSLGPTVPATCQGGAVHAPGAPPGGEPPPTYQWKHHAPCWLTTLLRSGYGRTHTEALCSAMVINN